MLIIKPKWFIESYFFLITIRIVFKKITINFYFIILITLHRDVTNGISLFIMKTGVAQYQIIYLINAITPTNIWYS